MDKPPQQTGTMRELVAMMGTWFKGPRRNRRDLYALSLMVLLAVSYSALRSETGLGIVWTVLVGVLAVLLLAAFDHGGWFKK